MSLGCATKDTICEPYVIILLNQIPIVHEHRMTRLVMKNGHEDDMCHDEIGLYAQNMDTIFPTQHGSWSSLWSLQERENLHFDFWWHFAYQLKRIVFMTCDCLVDETIPNPKQQSKTFVELKMTTMDFQPLWVIFCAVLEYLWHTISCVSLAKW